MPLDAASRTAPILVAQLAGTEILNTARSAVHWAFSAVASKLIHKLATSLRLLPKKVISVVRPGANALGAKYFIAGDSARQAGLFTKRMANRMRVHLPSRAEGRGEG